TLCGAPRRDGHDDRDRRAERIVPAEGAATRAHAARAGRRVARARQRHTAGQERLVHERRVGDREDRRPLRARRNSRRELEEVPSPDLDLSLAVVDRRGDLSELRIVRVVVGLTVLLPVENVEALDAELELAAAGDADVLEQAEVDRVVAASAEGIAAADAL